MRSPQLVLTLSAFLGLAFASVSCQQQTARVPQPDEEPQPTENPQAKGEPLRLSDGPDERLPPLSVKKDEAPLLLEEPDDQASAAKGPVADNSRCHVCHMNYEVEKLAVTHAKANVGCETCHGASDAHCSDEDNITPPEIMYPRAKVNRSCMACHLKKEIDTKAHKPVLKALAENKKLCTDCHGDHRLAHRTRRWNRTTGELIEDDKVRMIDKAPSR